MGVGPPTTHRAPVLQRTSSSFWIPGSRKEPARFLLGPFFLLLLITYSLTYVTVSYDVWSEGMVGMVSAPWWSGWAIEPRRMLIIIFFSSPYTTYVFSLLFFVIPYTTYVFVWVAGERPTMGAWPSNGPFLNGRLALQRPLGRFPSLFPSTHSYNYLLALVARWLVVTLSPRWSSRAIVHRPLRLLAKGNSFCPVNLLLL